MRPPAHWLTHMAGEQDGRLQASLASKDWAAILKSLNAQVSNGAADLGQLRLNRGYVHQNLGLFRKALEVGGGRRGAWSGVSVRDQAPRRCGATGCPACGVPACVQCEGACPAPPASVCKTQGVSAAGQYSTQRQKGRDICT